jgi:hypothetical protein
MSRFIQAVFGVRVTVLYKSGAKMRGRFRAFDINLTANELTAVAWKRPLLSWSREPLWLNGPAVEAIWQGKA